MCAFIKMVKSDGRELAHALAAEVPADFDMSYQPLDRVAPSDPAWILLADGKRRKLTPGRFGFSLPNEKRLLINARSETVHRLPAFRDAFIRRRCLVPVHGFYEYTGEKGDKRPICFQRPDGGVLLLHALYQDEINPQTGECRRTFTVLTTTPNELVAKVHNRMPVVTVPDSPAAIEWLAHCEPGQSAISRLRNLLVPASEELLIPLEMPRKPPPEKPFRLPRKPPKEGAELSEQRPAREQLKLF